MIGLTEEPKHFFFFFFFLSNMKYMQLKIIKYVHYLFSKSISSLYKYMCGGWGNFLRGSFLGSNSHGAVFRGNFLGAGFLESLNYICLVFLRKGQHNFFS